ncbi:porin [Euhalothece natronophila Z-M001]|uniref:Porin n=2 Tax=Euhalothece TaxID=65097 RepID=A0A5B8NTR6_9CHRO|nr:porin [Euhalothece natronophila Z-M001]
MASLKLIPLMKVAPVLVGVSFIAAQADPILAESAGSSEQDLLQQIDNYNNEGGDSLGEIDQVNNVNQLEDVSPDDWAFEALRNLVERYGCIAGYPDGTFRGNEPMTRYEFAAGLNACLQQIEQLIAADDQVDEGDLETLERLVQEFEAELTTLGTRVDDLEGRVGQLEDTQFSTTTQLSGGVDFALTSGFGSSKATLDGSNDIDTDSNIGFLYKADLNFDASFTGRDRLRVRLRSADGDGFTQRATHEEGRDGFAGDLTRLDDIRSTDGDFVLDTLTYRFPLGERATIVVGANDIDPDEAFEYNFGSGFILNDFIDGGDIYTFEGDNLGIFPGGRGDAGISTSFNLTDRISVGAGYTADGGDARDPQTGLFQDYSAAANINYAGDHFDIGLGYGRTAIGSEAFDIDSAFVNGTSDIEDGSFTQDAVGLRGAARLGRRTEIGGWVSYVDRNFDVDGSSDSQDDWAFGTNVAFFDVGREGSKLAIGFASPAQASDFEVGGEDIQLDRAYVAEVSYDFPVNDNISVIPGVMAVFNPENNSDNDNVYVGVLQTSFSF